MIFLCYLKCSTCQKAKAWLDANQIPYTLRDITTANPSYEELFTWQERSQLPLRKLFNTSGLLYRSQGLKDKLESMTKEEQLSLLATDGMLVKRPLLVDDDKILVGFQEAKWAEALLNDK